METNQKQSFKEKHENKLTVKEANMQRAIVDSRVEWIKNRFIGEENNAYVVLPDTGGIIFFKVGDRKEMGGRLTLPVRAGEITVTFSSFKYGWLVYEIAELKS